MALRQSVGDLACTLLSIVRTRIELFSLEASEQKGRLVVLMGLTAAALLFLTLAVLVFSIAVALYFWPTEQRYMALCVLALCYLVIGAGFLWAVRRKLVHGAMPFAATIDELRRDLALAERLREPSDAARPLGAKELP
ncbi:phage holin family protein [Parapusillimonas granuli]|uniref:Phage holin family protein n=1 Tax=Parapusillimonas granuli TaxID=380911 RepID=A0A853FXB3_9BURK|nr:phage holin family protein [Parapusillimonas granuli]MBB5215160.1 putative membrane protein YqjE [Parapusillimonas granuli]MEB2401814.1 phage holin family protein [Alcaligenaceae bacterium]NYT49478.1 phage holin family protein [Parapusillimonas granuli]